MNNVVNVINKVVDNVMFYPESHRVYRRTIEMLQCARNFKINCCLLIMSCHFRDTIEKKTTFEAVFMKNIENSHETLSLMSYEVLNCTQMT